MTQEEPLLRPSPAVLQDPDGEFGGVSARFPEYPAAYRCKDRIDVREIIAFQTVVELIERRQSSGPIKWLDLCCGRGNVLKHITTTLGELSRRVKYYGVDINLEHRNECQETIRKMGLNDHLAAPPQVFVGDILKPWNMDQGTQFDIVTLLNVLHEIPPFSIYSVLRNALDRCKYTGLVLIVDMCSLPRLEWQAITWQKEHLLNLMSPLLKQNKGVSLVQHSIPISIYPRRVDVWALRLRKSIVRTRVFPKWEWREKDTKHRNIVKSYLLRKKTGLSEQIETICRDTGELLVVGKEKAENENLRKLLLEYWAVSEALSSGGKGVPKTN